MFSLLQTKNIEIKNDETTLTYQESLLLQQRYNLLNGLIEANKQIDSKSLSLLQASAIIIGLISVFTASDFAGMASQLVPNFSSNYYIWLNLIKVISSISSFLSFIIMTLFTIKSLNPRGYEMPGSSDWEIAFTDYLYESKENCFKNILYSLSISIKSLEKLNDYKADWLTVSGYLLIFQITALMITILISQ